MTVRAVRLSFVALAALLLACSDGTDRDATPVAPSEPAPVSADWPLHGRTADEQRHSPLTAIHRGNVGELGLAWSYATGTTRGLESTPIVVDGVMYATGNWGVVFALDAKTGRELWRFDPQVPGGKARDACCDIVNRGVAVSNGRVFVGALDGRLIALDARTGESLWQTLTVDPRQPYTITGAPRVVGDRVIIGNGGADLGVRGYFGAYDAATGEALWRFYTVPASKDGPHEHPELALAAETWSKDSMWESGLGGTVWDSMAYDPELDLLYVGVGNASVYDRTKRSPGGGDNLFVSSVLAVRPETGRLVWHYQTTPGDFWDYTATQHIVLADLEIDGVVRKVLLQAPKNGFFYVLDRATGEFLSAEPYVALNWASHVDPESGRPVERPEAHWDSKEAFVTPAPPGGHSWHPMSFSPRTGLVYIPTSSLPYIYRAEKDFEFVPGRYNTGEDFPGLTADYQDYAESMEACNPSHITAWDPVEQRQAWRIDHDHPTPAGMLTTASDLLFQGRADGTLVAYDARDGTRLWDAPTGTGIMAPPVSYAIDGEQYVAVIAGLGGSFGGHFDWVRNDNDGLLLAFKLGGDAALPRVAKTPLPPRDPPDLDSTPGEIERGRGLYAHHCMRCHGMAGLSRGLYPDLRHSTREVHARWNDIVLGGIRQAGGMASFADLITAEESRAIQAYVVERANHEPGIGPRLALFAARFACVPTRWVVD